MCPVMSKFPDVTLRAGVHEHVAYAILAFTYSYLAWRSVGQFELTLTGDHRHHIDPRTKRKRIFWPIDIYLSSSGGSYYGRKLY
jgi:hypothetical protein